MLSTVANLLCFCSIGYSFSPVTRFRSYLRPLSVTSITNPSTKLIKSAIESPEVVVIGSGLGGLSCAALLAASGVKVCLLESHYEIGGCAHEFLYREDGTAVPTDRMKPEDHGNVYHFEAGPSLYSGLSQTRSPNPLKHVFQMIKEEPEWITYDIWKGITVIILSLQGLTLSVYRSEHRHRHSHYLNTSTSTNTISILIQHKHNQLLTQLNFLPSFTADYTWSLASFLIIIIHL
jgi:hypothetical protein